MKLITIEGVMVIAMSVVLIYTNTLGTANEIITTAIISGFLGYLTKTGIDLHKETNNSNNIVELNKGEQDEEINNRR